MAKVLAQRENGAKIQAVLISGIAGVGKTEFARSLGQRLAPTFPDFQVCIEVPPGLTGAHELMKGLVARIYGPARRGLPEVSGNQ